MLNRLFPDGKSRSRTSFSFRPYYFFAFFFAAMASSAAT